MSEVRLADNGERLLTRYISHRYWQNNKIDSFTLFGSVVVRIRGTIYLVYMIFTLEYKVGPNRGFNKANRSLMNESQNRLGRK